MADTLLKAEAIAYSKKHGTPLPPQYAEEGAKFLATHKRKYGEVTREEDEDPNEDWEAKKLRVLVETRHLDASSSESEESSEDEVEPEDETTLLLRELANIKRERAEKKAKEDAKQAAKEQEDREYDVAKGNPLLNPKDFNVKKRWDHDIVFKNQAKGTEDKKKKKNEFINDSLRSDFHQKFMVMCL